MIRKSRFGGMRGVLASISVLIADAVLAVVRRGSARAERRAHAQAIHRLTRALARAVEPADVVRIVTEAAIDSIDIRAAVIERLRSPAASSDASVALSPPWDAAPDPPNEHERTALPLRSNGRTLGALVLLRGERGPPLSDADLTWAQVLADIGAFALDRALALRREIDFRAQVMDIVDGVSDPFITLDEDGRITYLNASARQVSRRFASTDDLVGQAVWSVVPELRHDGMQAGFRRILEHRQPVHLEWLNPRLGGWMEIHAYPWKRGVAAYGRDVTDRKSAEARLVESEARLRTLANHLPDAAIFQAVEDRAAGLRCTYVSDGISRLNGVGTATILEHPAVLLEELDLASRAALAAAAAEARRALTPFRIELEAAHATDERRWYELAAEPRRGDGGRTVWDGLLLDVTPRKRAEQELARLTEGRARLLRGFSHDMKNPLGAADGLAQILELGDMGTLTAQQVDVVARIRASIRTALDLIDDVLDLARAESGGLDLERTSVDVTTIVGSLIEQHRPQALARGLTLELTNGPIPPRAMCDPTRVTQIVGNLITNAIKYTSNGRIAITVAGSPDGPTSRGPWVTIAVRDSGPGIPADKREAIFEEFTRLHDTSTTGAGVGLSISRRIARLMGGDVTVTDAEGGGSVFTLWLPADARRRSSAVPLQRADRRSRLGG